VNVVAERSIHPASRHVLERRAVASTVRALLFALAVLMLTGYCAVMARKHLDLNPMALMFASPLLTVYVVAFSALGTWSRAWCALDRADDQAHRWANAQASQCEEARTYLSRLRMLRRPMLQHDVWCLEEIQRSHMAPKDLAEPELDAREQLTA
jgi:hypothetical protein